ncbi:MAG: hypothetical protein LUD50_06730 [Clostridia bacterium]|nr:hypothetical protein [Clostridia bacterium]
MTESQVFTNSSHEVQYSQEHSGLCNVDESGLINAHNPNVCPNCGSLNFVRFGKTRNGVNRFRCKDCGKTFTPVTGTIFENHKISIREWTDFCLNMFGSVDARTDPGNSRNAITTSRYWLKKLFLILDDIQDNIVLSGTVLLDEVYVSEGKLKQEGSDQEADCPVREKQHRKVQHQYSIIIAADGTHILLFYDGMEKSILQKSYNAFCSHIAPGSSLIYNGAVCHSQLIQDLSEKGRLCIQAKASSQDGNYDSQMHEVNSIHSMLVQLIQSQSGFKREEIQGYLNLYAFVKNPPAELHEKLDIILNRAFINHIGLRYRDFYKKL